jgi:hypothetical protein
MLPVMILHARKPYTPPWVTSEAGAAGPLGPYVLNATLNWASAEAALGGSASALPNFNWTGMNFSSPQRGYLDARNMTQPAAAAGLAWLQYTTRAAVDLGCTGSCAVSTLRAARWALDYLTERIDYDPFWEVLLPFGAAAAARMTAELRGTEGAPVYDVDKLLGWILQDNETPPVSPFRWGWGTVSVRVASLIQSCISWHY